MGKGGGGTTPAGQLAGAYAENISKLSGPARRQYFGQLKEALTKGTISEQTPIIQQMVQQGLRSGSTAQDITRKSMAALPGSAGRSPYAKETLASQQALAQGAVDAIPSEVVSATALQAPAQSMNALGQANALLGSAGIAQGQAAQAAAAQDAQTASEAGAGAAVAIGIIAAI